MESISSAANMWADWGLFRFVFSTTKMWEFSLSMWFQQQCTLYIIIYTLFFILFEQTSFVLTHRHPWSTKKSIRFPSKTFFCYLMDPMGNVLLYVHEDLGDDFFCMICTSMTHTCHIVSCLALKSYFLVVLEISPFRVMVVTQVMESLLSGNIILRQHKS